ncbi:protein of unknown function DUF71 ATP-binding region [Pyrolobus fumarii 1A]|uniref:Diphthamide synthase domain-containing protein n=1 Tax=Pyrolobus fumarii (strain DSM 11204 / 1A) TaxID=694429 RepID=G0EEJ3_PYRF1|nr:protein of unknown function DUF71 ATP-binding region [Pyrolobus fumarii 1A]
MFAALKAWPIDYGIVLLYEFPRPNPHLFNLGKTLETLALVGVPIIVARLHRGREQEETVKLLQHLGVDEIVAGDVYIEDHLRYMESVAREAGASLREPLWGMDPVEVLYKEAEAGIEAVFIGANERMRKWLGRVFSRETVEELADYTRKVGVDPLGEHGEYHTLVINSPVHEARLAYNIGETRVSQGYYILRIV